MGKVFIGGPEQARRLAAGGKHTRQEISIILGCCYSRVAVWTKGQEVKKAKKRCVAVGDSCSDRTLSGNAELVDFEPKIPATATATLRGSPERVEVYARRQEAGEHIYHAGDSAGGICQYDRSSDKSWGRSMDAITTPKSGKKLS